MILIPSQLKSNFQTLYTQFFQDAGLTDTKTTQRVTTTLKDANEITVAEANMLINSFQSRIENLFKLNQRLINPGSFFFDHKLEHAYCLVDAVYLQAAVTVLSQLNGVAIRLYFAVNKDNRMTIAIVGEDISGNPVLPTAGGSFFVYENFGGGGTIDSTTFDLP